MLQVIERYGVMPDRQPSLGPIQGALTDMGLMPFLRPERTIIVAGTNGKGTTTATLTHLLRAAGQKVGMYTSPHLVSITERIQTQESVARDITPKEMLSLYEKVQSTMEKWKLSHFEVLTLMMTEFFYRSGPKLDWYVIETGMGGSFDATNALAHQYCVITTLGMDHEKFLGPGLANVAKNKFGIVHPHGANFPKGCDVVMSPLPEEARPVMKQVADATGARFYAAPAFEYHAIPAKQYGDLPQFFLKSPWGKAELSLAGPRAALNTTTALKTFEVLGFQPSAFLPELKNVKWEGRMTSKTVQGKTVYFSGDHNPQGIESLVELLKDYSWKTLHLVVGVGIEKDATGIFDLLEKIPRTKIHLTQTPFRGKSREDYGPLVNRAASFHTDPLESLNHTLASIQPGEMVIVTGSLYLVGYIMSSLQTSEGSF